MNAPRHDDILNMLDRRYSGPVMNNVYRGDLAPWTMAGCAFPCASILNAVTPPHLLQSSPALRRPVERESAEYGRMVRLR